MSRFLDNVSFDFTKVYSFGKANSSVSFPIMLCSRHFAHWSQRWGSNVKKNIHKWICCFWREHGALCGSCLKTTKLPMQLSPFPKKWSRKRCEISKPDVQTRLPKLETMWWMSFKISALYNQIQRENRLQKKTYKTIFCLSLKIKDLVRRSNISGTLPRETLAPRNRCLPNDDFKLRAWAPMQKSRLRGYWIILGWFAADRKHLILPFPATMMTIRTHFELACSSSFRKTPISWPRTKTSKNLLNMILSTWIILSRAVNVSEIGWVVSEKSRV